MSGPDLMSLAERERASLLDLLSGLTAEQWVAPSLCSRWKVRDVAVHVVSYDELSKPALLAAFVRGGVRIDSVNDLVLRRYADLAPAEVIDMVARCRKPRGITTGFRGGIALTDATIHHQDIRRALGLPRTIPEDQLRRVLDFALTARMLPAAKNSRGLRLAASDIDWSTGSGLEVTGPAEALLMAMAGRPHALADLDGEGLEQLKARVVAA